MKSQLNLLPKEFHDAMASARRLKGWLILFWVLGALGFWVLSREEQSVARLEKEQQKRSPQVESLHALQAESKAARDKLNELSTKHTLVSMLESELPVVQILGVFSQSASDLERRVQVTDLRAEEVVRNLPAADSPKKPAGNRGPQRPEQEKVLAVVVTGIAQDDMVVARFVSKLRESQMFESVKLNSTTGDQQQSLPGRHFEVECVY